MHCEKKKLSWKEQVFDEKKSCSLKIKVSEVLLCFKDKESDEKVLVFGKDKVYDESTSLCLKVIKYLFLWNVKFYDNKSYNILQEEVYEEKFCYSLRRL